VIRVLIADDQDMVRTGLRLILSRETDIEVIADAGNGAEAVEIARRLRPDVVLMDVRMPVMDGIAATARLAEDAGSTARVLILTTFDDEELVYDALAVGASGFLLKDAPADDLIAAIHILARGESILAPAITRRLIDKFTRQQPRAQDTQSVERLTAREREVLRSMADGLNNAEIAQFFTIGEATVKTHVARILQKLDARDRVQAVIAAYRSGLAYEPPASRD
jgi:DNA-binding NarL/FixJ family response regulator